MDFRQRTMPLLKNKSSINFDVQKRVINEGRQAMNNNYRKPLQSTQLEYYDVRQAVEDIQPGAYAKLPYTSKVLAEQLVRR